MFAGTAEERLQALKDGQRANANSLGGKFRVRRFFLDTGATRFTANRSDCKFGTGIKSFWVCDTNNKSFVAKIVVNPDSDRDQYSGLPLRPNMNQSFEFPVADAVIEFASQPGTWIDIAYSESEDINVGSLEADVSGMSTARDGSAFSQGGITLGAASPFSVIAPSDSARGVSEIENRSSDWMYVGTDAELSDPAFEDKCKRVGAGETLFYRNTAELRGRVVTGSGKAHSFHHTI